MTFRFGVVAATARTGAEWTGTARRAEQLGYDILLVPDTLHTLSPFAALAAAAASTTRLRVGTYVLSAPNRTPEHVAWETRTLQLLSGGRFELGIGGGRPGADRDAATLGGAFGPPGERLGRGGGTRPALWGAGFPRRSWWRPASRACSGWPPSRRTSWPWACRHSPLRT